MRGLRSISPWYVGPEVRRGSEIESAHFGGGWAVARVESPLKEGK